MSGWSARARLTWWLVVTFGAVCVAALAVTDLRRASRELDSVDWAILAGLVAAIVLFALRPLRMAPDRYYSAAAAPLIALALLFDPVVAVLAAGTAAIVTQLASRVPWYVATFNVSQRVAAVAASGMTCIAVGRGLDLPAYAGCAAAGAVYFAVNSGAVAAISAARKGRSLALSWRDMVREQWVGDSTLIAGGILVAIHIRSVPVAVPFIAVPLWLAWRVLRDTAEIRRLNETLKEALDSQRRFVANASHELRTPVASLRAQLDVLRGRPASGPAEWSVELDHMAHEAARMSALLADLLALAHADGGAPLVAEPVGVEDLLLDVYREARPLAGGVDFRVTLDDEAAHAPVVFGDRERLRQLFLNLVTNALRFTPEGGTVEVRCHISSHDVDVAVADTGSGIPPEALPRIFERFYRVDRGRAREAATLGGSGLGLSIAKWIAEAHGGSIRVASQVDVGSTFTVRLPLAEPAAEATRTAVRAVPAAAR
ncbi:MAG TPA: ATP-binding protein [Chloroflexota bacterium]|nr:ATP-binding protein [Chloroflexota bacterium]